MVTRAPGPIHKPAATRSSTRSPSPAPARPTSRQTPSRPDMVSLVKDVDSARSMQPIGKAALIASVGGRRAFADWTNPDHRLRRLLAEFIGMAGLTFILSGGAGILAPYGGPPPPPRQTRPVTPPAPALF